MFEVDESNPPELSGQANRRKGAKKKRVQEKRWSYCKSKDIRHVLMAALCYNIKVSAAGTIIYKRFQDRLVKIVVDV